MIIKLNNLKLLSFFFPGKLFEDHFYLKMSTSSHVADFRTFTNGYHFHNVIDNLKIEKDILIILVDIFYLNSGITASLYRVIYLFEQIT